MAEEVSYNSNTAILTAHEHPDILMTHNAVVQYAWARTCE